MKSPTALTSKKKKPSETHTERFRELAVSLCLWNICLLMNYCRWSHSLDDGSSISLLVIELAFCSSEYQKDH